MSVLNHTNLGICSFNFKSQLMMHIRGCACVHLCSWKLEISYVPLSPTPSLYRSLVLQHKCVSTCPSIPVINVKIYITYLYTKVLHSIQLWKVKNWIESKYIETCHEPCKNRPGNSPFLLLSSHRCRLTPWCWWHYMIWNVWWGWYV
jgi:hypothetical protein